MLGNKIQSPSSILGRTTSPRGRTTSTSSPELPTTALSTNLLEIPFLIPPPPREQDPISFLHP